MKQNKIPRNEYIRKPVGKTNPYKDDVIYSNLGQWKYPGQVTRIPSGNITMQGVPYPVYGEDNLGYSQMMYPGMDYQFPGQYVTEIPMAQTGLQTPPKKTSQDDILKRYNDLLKKDEQLFSQIEKDRNTSVFSKIGSKIADVVKNKVRSDYEDIKSAGEYIKGLVGGFERKWESMQEEDPRSIVPVVKQDTHKVTTPKTLPSKKNAKAEVKQPDTSFGYKELYTVPDVNRTKDSLVAFTNTFDNDQGARYMIGHKAKEVTDAGAQKTFNNARAVAHFLRDSDILPNQKITPKEWGIAKGFKFKTTSPGKTVSAVGFNDPEKFRTLYKPNPANDGTYLIKYLKNKELTPEKSKDYSKEGWELDFTVSNQHKFSDIAWDKEGTSTGYAAKSKWLPLKNGKHTYIPYKNKDGFSRFSGGSVVYLFKDPKTGKSIGVDVAGSVNTIKKAGEDIIKKYGIKPQDLELAYHDMGSYSAKPKAHGDKLDYNQWLDYNQYNRGFSGAPLIIPKEEYGGDPSLPDITGHYPFGGQNTKTHTHMSKGGWLDEYPDGGSKKKSNNVWGKKDVTEEYYNRFIKKYPGAIGLDPNNVDKDGMHAPIYPKVKKKKEVIIPDRIEPRDPSFNIDQEIKPAKAIPPISKYSGPPIERYWNFNSGLGTPVMIYHIKGQEVGREYYDKDKKVYQTDYGHPSGSTRTEMNAPFDPMKLQTKKHGGWLDDYQSGGEKPWGEMTPKERVAYLDKKDALKKQHKKADAQAKQAEAKSREQAKKEYYKDWVAENYDKGAMNPLFQTVAGFTPLGTIPFAMQSGVSAINNLAQGNYLDAGIDAAFASPLFKGLKGTKKVIPKAKHITGKMEGLASKKDIKNINNDRLNFRDFQTNKEIYNTDPADFRNFEVPGMYDEALGYANEVKQNWYNKNIPMRGGHTDVPSFNKQLKEMITQAQFGKRPLETKIGPTNVQKSLIRPENIEYIGNDMPNVSYGHYLDTDLMPGKTKPYTAIQALQSLNPNATGGEIGEDDFRRGGPYTPPKLKRKVRKQGTSKNIQSSINKIFTRNYDVFGPSGKNIYNPNVYKTGGWLDNLD